MKTKHWSHLHHTVLALALAAIAAANSGCVVAIGNDGTKPPLKATLGQQLTDLKKARDNGSITEEEYQAERKKMLEDYGKKTN